MTPDRLADLHRLAFTAERPWSAAEFTPLLDSPFVSLFAHPHGFALARTVAGESELLTLAVDPSYQRQGIGRNLVNDWLETASAHAERAFLDVASDNIPAISLYSALGFAQVGQRRAYYARKDAPAADALLMQRCLTFGQGAESASQTPEIG